MSETVLVRIVGHLEAALDYNASAYVAPVALLWPDEGRQWEPVIDRFRQRVPLMTPGASAPALPYGPAYLLRCLLSHPPPPTRAARRP